MSELTDEERETARRLREEYERKKKDLVNNPPTIVHQPDKWDYPPGDDPVGPRPKKAQAIDARRARAALMGLAVGDALGTTHEFQRLHAPTLPTLALEPLTDIVGGGPFHLQPGQVTDDTQMAVCLADSIRERRGFDVDDVAARYVAWMEHAFDVGGQTSAALQLVRAGVAPRDAGRRVWEERGRGAAGNGSLMRTAPIGIFIGDRHARLVAALRESAITHFDPRCQMACAAYDAALSAGIRGATPEQMWQAAAQELYQARGILSDEWPADGQKALADGFQALADDLQAAQWRDPQLYGPDVHLLDQEGFVRVAFRFAFWHLLHTERLDHAVMDAANRGGDADTNAAIAGALVGAARGLDTLPPLWEQSVLQALDNEEGLVPLAIFYHPRRFMEALSFWGARGFDAALATTLNV